MSLFKKAATIVEPKAPKKSGKKEFVIDGLETLAQVDHVIKALTGVKASVESSVKELVMDTFMEEARDGKRPANFKGVDGPKASASCELRKRSTASALTDEEVAMFAKFGLTPEKVILTQKLFGVNPTYAGDEALLEKVSAALEGVVPDDFFVIQEERSKMVVNDECLDTAFKKKAPREIIAACTSLALKPVLQDANLSAVMDDLKAILTSVESTDDSNDE